MIRFDNRGLVGGWDFNNNVNDILGFNNLTLQDVRAANTYYVDGYRGKSLRVGRGQTDTTLPYNMSYMNGSAPWNNVLQTSATTLEVIMANTTSLEGECVISLTGSAGKTRIVFTIDHLNTNTTNVTLSMKNDLGSNVIIYASNNHVLNKYPAFNRFTLTATGNSSSKHTLYINGDPVSWSTITTDVSTYRNQWTAYSNLNDTNLITFGAVRTTTANYTRSTTSTADGHYILDTVRIYNYAKSDVQIKNEQSCTQRFI